MARWFVRNPGFELGNQHWAVGSGWAIGSDAPTSRSGSWRAAFTGVTPNTISCESSVAGFPARPGLRYSAQGYLNGSAATAGQGQVEIRFSDAAQAFISQVNGNVVSAGAGYTLSSVVDAVAPARTKWVVFRFAVRGSPDGSPWYADDMVASGDVIENLPASAAIQSNRIITAETVAEFDPLIGNTRYTEFNAGMSDRWAGVYNFVPKQRGDDLSELLAFIRRIGRLERFFAYDPDHTVPLGGVINGLAVNGAVSQGSTRVPVDGGSPSTTPLVAGDYVEIRAQYFQVQRPVQIGPQGTGEIIVWPSVRAALVDGEEVITDNPKMLARITSPMEWPHDVDTFARLSVSWEEV